MSYLQAVLKNLPQEELERIMKVEESKEKVEVSENKKVREFKPKDSKSTNKNSLRRKPKEEIKKVEREPSFYEALTQAKESLIELSKPNQEDHEFIVESLNEIKNWSGHKIKLDLSEDILEITVEDKLYKFSKKKILQGRSFQNELTKFYKETYGNVYLKFYEPKGESTEFIVQVKLSTR